MASIAAIQERKEQENNEKYEALQEDASTAHRQSDAARTLQRTYRGHRGRRELKGLTLRPSDRWSEVGTSMSIFSPSSSMVMLNEGPIQALKEAKYRDLTTPRHSSRPQTSDSANKPVVNDVSSDAQSQWHRAGNIARRAGGDTHSSDEDPDAPPKEKEAKRRERDERMKTAKTMDLPYFLEMVDLHHRYGSHLRKYHAEWKERPTQENFFYWLDYGEGKEVSLPNCSREKLDSMKIRYLGREERINYAVEVDEKGKLCWKRNGVLVNTNEEWRDSIKGIVRVDDEAPTPSPGLGFYVSSSGSSGLGSSDESDVEDSAGKEKPTAVTVAGKTLKARAHKTKAKVLDHRPFKRPPKESGGKNEKKKKSMWIFVADTAYNLYIGIKQSGAFQHSSFLHGGRVSAAGTIKVKDGKLQYMQPRSGHYKPPASSFRAFVKSLQKRGIDMSILSVPKSYAVLMGIEGYTKGLKQVSTVKKALGLEKRGGGGNEDEAKEKEQKEKDKGGGETEQGFKADSNGGEQNDIADTT
ncbi:MAG: hypothetical protein Q9183_002097 [Haloplaca sp. 2 TL-2023]